MKTYKTTADVDGVITEVYKDAPDADTATRDVLDDLTLGAIESPELVTILDVELLDDNNIYQIKKEDAKYIVFQSHGKCEQRFGLGFATSEEAIAAINHMEKNNALRGLYEDMFDDFFNQYSEYLKLPNLEVFIETLIDATNVDYLLTGLQKIKEQYDTN